MSRIFKSPFGELAVKPKTMQARPVVQLGLATQLFQELNASGMRYCAWKSTHELDKALAGGTDLDLLVDRTDTTRLRELLLHCDCKPFVSAPRRQYPAIEDYIGFDRRSGALVHLHLHYRPVLGGQYTKNYVLPLDASLLDNTRMKSGVRVPIPELELSILALRSLLKYRDRDLVRDMLRVPGRSGLSESLQREVASLAAMTDLTRVKTVIERHADFIPPELVLDFVRTAHESPRDGWSLNRLRNQTYHVLEPFRRASLLRNRLDYFGIIAVQDLPLKRVREYLLQDRHKRPATGGFGIAFIGTDGAGKSTAVKKIAQWLNWRVNVRVYYMGTTHPSRLTKLVRTVADGGQTVHSGCVRLLGREHRMTQAVRQGARLLTDLRYLAEARDRYHRYLAGQRNIAQGKVVIYDRYPLTAVSIDGRPMDGPRVAVGRAADSSLSGLAARIARAEESYYRRIRPPDHVVVLRVSPQVSQARKPEHRQERIQAKAQALADFSRSGLNLTEVDAEQPLDQVLLQIKSTVWSWM